MTVERHLDAIHQWALTHRDAVESRDFQICVYRVDTRAVGVYSVDMESTPNPEPRKMRKPFDLDVQHYSERNGRGGWFPGYARVRSFATLEAAERAAGKEAIRLAQEGKVEGWRVAIYRDGQGSFGTLVSVIEPVR